MRLGGVPTDRHYVAYQRRRPPYGSYRGTATASWGPWHIQKTLHPMTSERASNDLRYSATIYLANRVEIDSTSVKCVLRHGSRTFETPVRESWHMPRASLPEASSQDILRYGTHYRRRYKPVNSVEQSLFAQSLCARECSYRRWRVLSLLWQAAAIHLVVRACQTAHFRSDVRSCPASRAATDCGQESHSQNRGTDHRQRCPVPKMVCGSIITCKAHFIG